MDLKKDMYTLGMICRAIWPAGETIPVNIMNTILTQPATGLGMATQHKAADKVQLADLITKLPADLSDPPGGVSELDQGPFWIGYYHYLTAVERSEKFGAKELKAAGFALYGPRWQTDLARSLDLDSRRIRAWMANERPIPAGVWAEIAGLLRLRKLSIDKVLQDLNQD